MTSLCSFDLIDRMIVLSIKTDNYILLCIQISCCVLFQCKFEWWHCLCRLAEHNMRDVGALDVVFVLCAISVAWYENFLTIKVQINGPGNESIGRFLCIFFSFPGYTVCFCIGDLCKKLHPSWHKVFRCASSTWSWYVQISGYCWS